VGEGTIQRPNETDRKNEDRANEACSIAHIFVRPAAERSEAKEAPWQPGTSAKGFLIIRQYEYLSSNNEEVRPAGSETGSFRPASQRGGEETQQR